MGTFGAERARSGIGDVAPNDLVWVTDTTYSGIYSTPIGGPITGLIADALGVFWATAYGGLVAVVAVAIAVVATRGSMRPVG